MKSTNLIKFSLTKKVGELSDTISYECQFCNKIVTLDEEYRRMCERISDNSFFCPFCIRHGFLSRSNCDVLMLSFRGLIGYYYHAYYCHDTQENRMYLSEIRDLIEIHATTGLENPVFSYDPDTFMWFVDFSKVGRKKKLSLDDILLTVESILDCFEQNTHFESQDFRDQFTKSIKKFYTNRCRPPHQKQLIPTLKGIGDPKLTDEELEWIRYITSKDLLLRS